MFTRPPDLTDARVAEAARSAWGLAIDSVEHAPVGFGSYHWVVAADSRTWWLTVDGVGDGETFGALAASLSTARLLHDSGLAFVIAPRPTDNGEVLARIDDRSVAALYPYVDGEYHSWGPFPDRNAWIAVLDRVVGFHSAPAEALRSVRADDPSIPSRQHLDTALATLSQPWVGGPFAELLRHLLADCESTIRRRLARYEVLATSPAERLVVTHGEPHRGNTITAASGVVLVDWDTTRLAPPERDLWWLAVEDDTMAAEYETLTGYAVDREGLERYRLRWDLADLALFTAQFRGPHEENEDTRTAWEAVSGYLRDHRN